jgi:phosphatidylserine decarboxylase
MPLYQSATFTVPDLHPAGWPFVGGAAVLWALLAWALGTFGFFVGLLFCAWVAYFFRDPERVTPTGDNLVISPADGKVCFVGEAVPPAELGLPAEPMARISIFLNLIDVHVNRIPVAGTIVGTYSAGSEYLNASDPRASDANRRLSIKHRLADGREIAYVQVAGLVARQIINTLKPEQPVKAGERFGIIRFGSRADIYLPLGTTSLVSIGQTMVGGETVLAKLS